MWGWDAHARRYRDTDTGRFLSRDVMLDYVTRSLDATGIVTDQLARLVGDGTINARDWALVMRQETKNEYLRQYILGRGGRDQMDHRDWGRIGAMVKEQYKYLQGFAGDVASGNLTPEQIAARSRMYINSAVEGYEKARARNADDLGMNEESWHLQEDAEHCDDCVMYAGQGWQPIGTFPEPGDGSTQCLTNCKCWKSYRNSESGQEY